MRARIGARMRARIRARVRANPRARVRARIRARVRARVKARARARANPSCHLSPSPLICLTRSLTSEPNPKPSSYPSRCKASRTAPMRRRAPTPSASGAPCCDPEP